MASLSLSLSSSDSLFADSSTSGPSLSKYASASVCPLVMDPFTLKFSDRSLEDAFIAERVKTIGYGYGIPVMAFLGLQGALLCAWLICGFHQTAALTLGLLIGSWMIHQYWILSDKNRARVYHMTCKLQGLCMFMLLFYYCLHLEVHPPLPGSQFRVEAVMDAGCTMLGCLIVHIAHFPPQNKLWTCLFPALAHIFKPVWNIGGATESSLWIGATLMGTFIGYILESSLRSLYLGEVRESSRHLKQVGESTATIGVADTKLHQLRSSYQNRFDMK